MSIHLQRAQLLYNQNRYEQAEQELGLTLAADSQDSLAHALMAQCLLARKQFDGASDHAAQAVQLAPDSDVAHAAAAHVWLERNYLDRAEQAARAAVGLDPFEPGWRSLLAMVLFRQERWADALAAAEEGLELDPEDMEALNLRAAALRQLGRSDKSKTSLQEALAQQPESAWTHANLGWSFLAGGNHAEAERHFREALRLDPELEKSGTGVIEAIKAKNPIYRAILHGFLWISRLTTKGQWYFIIGAYLAYRFAASLAQQHPAWGIVLWPVVVAYLALVVITWFTTPLSNLCLRLHPFGKLALSADERRASNWVGGALGLACVLGMAALVLGSSLAGILAAMSGLFAIPLAMLFGCADPAARRWMRFYTAGVGVVGALLVVWLMIDHLLSPEKISTIVGGQAAYKRAVELSVSCFQLYLWGCVLSVWATNIARSVAWKQ